MEIDDQELIPLAVIHLADAIEEPLNKVGIEGIPEPDAMIMH